MHRIHSCKNWLTENISQNPKKTIFELLNICKIVAEQAEINDLSVKINDLSLENELDSEKIYSLLID